MQESVGSLRAFFILVGLSGAVGGTIGLLGVLEGPQMVDQLSGLGMVGGLLGALGSLSLGTVFSGLGLGMFSILLLAVSIVISLAYLYCGAVLTTLLATNPGMVKTTIMANLGFQLLGLICWVVRMGVSAALLFPAIGLGISLYLLSAVKRLSEAAA